VTVPPQMVSRRPTPEYASAPATVNPSVLNLSDGNGYELGVGSFGHIEEIAPPDGAHRGGATQPLYVARKS
jgi:hypothetical protein